MMFTTLLLVALAALSASAASDDNITVTIDPTADNVTEGANFIFFCNTTADVADLSVYIDRGNAGPKFRRINFTTGHDYIKYNFSEIVYTDNGTVMRCRVNSVNGTFNSPYFILEVFYAPRLTQGNNITNLTELEESKATTLPVTVLTANPPVTSVMASNDSKNLTGVTFENGTSSGNYSFTEATPDNRGNYTVTFTNPIGTTHFTYRTYFGGEPDDVDVKCHYTTPDNNAVLTCTVSDTSSAPATAVNVSVGELNQINMTFETLPATDVQIPALDMNLNDLSADNYTVTFVAINQLGSSVVYNSSLFIDGKYTETLIKAVNSSVVEKSNFTFICSTPTALDTNFTVFVNNASSTKVVPVGPAVNGSQTFLFTNASWLDNGAALMCVSNNTWKSPELSMEVFYSPRFNGSVPPYLVNGSLMEIIIITLYANPEPTFHQWRHNGESLREGVISTPNSLNFSEVLLEDIGNYSVLTGNGIGNASYSFEIDIYYAPFFHQDSLSFVRREGEVFELSINATANPPITSSNWWRYGKRIEPSERLILGLLNITIKGVEPIDSHDWAVNATNEVGSTLYYFSLNVLYAPNITTETQFAYINTTYKLYIDVASNPNNFTTVWMKGGEEIKSGDGVTVTKDSITFTSLGLSDNGTYTVNSTNIVGSAEDTVDLAIYHGPVFAEDTNKTVWVEYATGSDVTLLCKVIASYPSVTSLVISSPNKTNESNWEPVVDGFNSIAVHIPKASQKNREDYTCEGTNGKTSGYKTFQTFIGGAPDKTGVIVTVANHGSDLNVFSIRVSDDSEAPPRSIIFTDPVNGGNQSFNIPYPLIDGRSYFNESFYSATYSELESGDPYMLVYANNSLGVALIKKVEFKLPPKPTKGPTGHKSKAGAIAAGVIVPLAVIFIAVGVAFGVYYVMKRRKRMSGFSPLTTVADSDVTTTNYGTTNS